MRQIGDRFWAASIEGPTTTACGDFVTLWPKRKEQHTLNRACIPRMDNGSLARVHHVSGAVVYNGCPKVLAIDDSIGSVQSISCTTLARRD